MTYSSLGSSSNLSSRSLVKIFVAFFVLIVLIRKTTTRRRNAAVIRDENPGWVGGPGVAAPPSNSGPWGSPQQQQQQQQQQSQPFGNNNNNNNIGYNNDIFGEYIDPASPNCLRKIERMGLRTGGFTTTNTDAIVRGADSTGTTSACVPNRPGPIWQVNAKVLDGEQEIVVDLSPKGGTLFAGKRVAAGILWENGDVWNKKQ